MDQDTGEELVVKNADVELPIASVTKLMTALVIAESDVDLDEKVRITREDYVRSTAHSKLISGMRLTRESLLKAALMSSDNRAAAALARTYPGGRKAFVAKMNERAAAIGMTNSFLLIRRGWITAITPRHVIWANWFAAVYQHQEIRDASTTSMARISTGRRQINLATTNRLIGDPSWRIGIQRQASRPLQAAAWSCRAMMGERRLCDGGAR